MIQREGYVRMRVDGELYDVTDAPELTKNKNTISKSSSIVLWLRKVSARVYLIPSKQRYA